MMTESKLDEENKKSKAFLKCLFLACPSQRLKAPKGFGQVGLID